MKTQITLIDGSVLVGSLVSSNEVETVLQLEVGVATLPAEEIASTCEVKEVVKSESSAPKSGSKREQAQFIFNANAEEPRKVVIQMFIEQLDMTPAGASTYYASCKKAAQ